MEKVDFLQRMKSGIGRAIRVKNLHEIALFGSVFKVLTITIILLYLNPITKC